MGRIERAFERRYQELLGELGARDRAKGVLRFQYKARLAAQTSDLSRAYSNLLIALLEKVHRFRWRRNRQPAQSCHVYCDAGLGGLARWLRASGCEALWMQDISDSELVREAQRLNATIITTDSLLLDRRAITHGEVRAIWVPPTLTMLEQLRLVQAELQFPAANLDSRCMRCGGELVEVEKESVKDRIPPRTYRWLDDYFECSSCHQLFWEGSHWRRIRERLDGNPKPENRSPKEIRKPKQREDVRSQV